MRPIIPVGVVEPNEIFRRGLVSCLSTDPAIRIAYESAGPPAGESSALVLIAGTSLPPAHAIDPAVPLIVYTDDAHWDPPSGAPIAATLPRHSLTPAQLLAAVHAAAAGLHVSVAIDGAPARPRLDDRRQRILRLLADGADTRTIAHALCYSERTVKTLIGDLEHSLGARSRAQAVAEGIRRGLI